MTNDSIVFDRAASFYDETRALPAEAQAQVTALLARELEGVAPVLELGVGTGRMALPLHQRRVPLVGADLSEPMLRRLIENAGGRLPFPVVRADGRELPLRTDAVAAVFLCHVFHLIPAWRAVLDEIVRVARPGGLVLVDLGGAPTAVGRAVGRHFNRQAGLVRPRPGVEDPAELDEAMAQRGAELRLLPQVHFTVDFTISAVLGRLAGNQFSSTWSLTDEQRLAAVDATRQWALAEFGDLDAPRAEAVTIQWRAYRLPDTAGRPAAGCVASPR
jgi:SAM-dependent methyltransferase